MPVQMTDKEIQIGLERQLLDYACEYGVKTGIGTLQEHYLRTPNLYVRANGNLLGYITEWNLLADGRTAEIGHFAVEVEYVGRGFGRALAHGLAKMVRDEFEVDTIIFVERHYSDQYGKFFKGLGATPIVPKMAKKGVLNWIWKIPPVDE